MTLCLVASARAEDPAAIRREIAETYDFHPHELSKDETRSRSKDLDAFWTKAEANPGDYVPALRAELAAAPDGSFLLFDGASLLLRLSDDPADRKLALAGFERCDLRDVQDLGYFRLVHRLAALGEDTTTAALRILGDKDFKVFIAEHYLTLGQDVALSYLLLPLPETRWLEPVTRRLAAETDPTAQKSLLTVLWLAQTPAGDAAIERFAGDSSRPREERAFAKELLARNHEDLSDLKLPRELPSEAELRRERREVMRRVSDEALGEAEEKTAMLIAVRRTPANSR